MKPLAGGALENASLALRFVGSNPHVTVAIPGMSSVEEAEENLSAMENASPLTPEERSRMEELRRSLGTQFCRRCNYCAPCTVGISIPNVFLMDGYLTRYGLSQWAHTRYEALGKRACDCIGCGVCETRCPYHLPIREMLRRASARLDG